MARAVVSGDIISTKAVDIADYLKVFAALDRVADYGGSARTLIRKVMDYFS